MKDNYILTAESVTAGHPDKLCDTINCATGLQMGSWTLICVAIQPPALPAKYWRRRAKFLSPENCIRQRILTWKPLYGKRFKELDMTVIIM